MDQLSSLALARIGIGAAAWAAPGPALGAAGLDGSPFLGRLFGVREVALGAITLAAPPQQRRQVVLTGIAVDALDAVAGTLAIRSASVPAARAALFTGAALAAVATGVLGLRQRRRAVPRP